MKQTSSSQSYFNHREDLARCTSGQHARIWLVWRFVRRHYPQALTAQPRWPELMLCGLLHRAPGLVMVLAVLWKRMNRSHL
ncbi:MAG: hypothetical protein WCP34_03080 [Pseudomonadota bacterium]